MRGDEDASDVLQGEPLRVDVGPVELRDFDAGEGGEGLGDGGGGVAGLREDAVGSERGGGELLGDGAHGAWAGVARCADEEDGWWCHCVVGSGCDMRSSG